MARKLTWTLIVCVSLGAVGVFSFGFGAVLGQFRPERAEPYNQWVLNVLRVFINSRCEVENTASCGFNDTTERIRVSCSDYRNGPDTAVLFAFGQSNSANWGQGKYTSKGNVGNFNYHDGLCYKAQDPLLGADGNEGSVWGRVGDKLIESGHYTQVLIVPFGIGGTALAEWIPGARLHPRVTAAANALLETGIKPTHVVWHQGETEVLINTTTQVYEQQFAQLLNSIRELGIDAPVYPAVATVCKNKGSEQIRFAQQELAKNLPGVLPGPDTDTLISMYQRPDMCHFTSEGLEDHAQLWVQALLGDSTQKLTLKLTP